MIPLGRDQDLPLKVAAVEPLVDTAVPIDLELGGEFDTLVITGPNTGGKTYKTKQKPDYF